MPAKTAFVCFPFDLFGHSGTRAGAELLGDAVQEMLADARREKSPTRSKSYLGKVTYEEFLLERLTDYADWRAEARTAADAVLARGDFLLWASGNHLGVLPVYEALGPDTLVVQFDAHLDVYRLGDVTRELSHGNFLLHAESPLPTIVNLGHRELALREADIAPHFRATFSAEELHADPGPALDKLRSLAESAERILFDIDCDVFDPAYFPGVCQPEPFGLSPACVATLLGRLWSEKVVGLALSEFSPAHDERDRSLATLLWLVERTLLRNHEKRPSK